MEEAVHNRGYAFVDVKPRVTRDVEKHTVDLTFDVGEGPRVYVERIDIVGNTRTEDKVIRREFRLAEGDPFSAEAVRRTKTRLTDLGYFQNVDITTNPGSAPGQGGAHHDDQREGDRRTVLRRRLLDRCRRADRRWPSASATLSAPASTPVSTASLAQRRSSINTSITDPYFLDRNLVAGADVFLIQTDYLGTEPYDERREGFALRLGYSFNEHLRQVWSYSLVDRDVYDIETGASPFILNEAGYDAAVAGQPGPYA